MLYADLGGDNKELLDPEVERRVKDIIKKLPSS